MEFTILYLICCFIFGIFFDFNSLACCIIVLFICLLCDLRHVWTVGMFVAISKIKRIYRPKHFLETKTYQTICSPLDVDYNLVLTEESLYRKCNLAHAQFFIENSINHALKMSAGKMHIRQRYIQQLIPMKIFERFEILTKVIYWDESIFYVKQSIIRHSDNFRCAVIYSMFHISGATTLTVLEQIYTDTDDVKRPSQSELIRHLQGLQDGGIDNKQTRANGHKH